MFTRLLPAQSGILSGPKIPRLDMSFPVRVTRIRIPPVGRMTRRFRRTRGAVERTLVWLQGFCQLNVGYEGRPVHEAFLTLACALVYLVLS